MKLPKELIAFDSVCSRYAKVLFSLPKDVRDSVRREIGEFVLWAKTTDELWNLVSSEYLSHRYKYEFFEEFKKQFECSKETENFFELLVNNERVSSLQSILILFDFMKNQQNGVVKAYMISALPIPKKYEKFLAHQISRKIGREVELKIEVDCTLILGGILLWDNFMIDASLATSFKRIEEGAIYAASQN
ncbi:ATP synthase F1 subunit delta [Candidatus Hydrogenosomobacter endosymbioticus]|uniref:ATP synthase subunit delta n=1 Tax=Candidatus Hydrogenosomobacter endosymbioticus TaxID=2558174 RepID=A0ABN6L2M4_9PROT|nr:ATP synthase F1 subunit delta [Candidatus Hydrogenosomobacter endosymbioticus]BDB96126.1 hypothetical protein HYD_2590 [Candidatus Hydrogenosomobacter endosymbioticus]